MSLFDIDYSTQVNNLLPSEYRTNTIKKFIRALIESCNTKAIEFSLFDADVRKRSKFNAQKLVLQSALNNIYGITVAPFIQIETQATAGNTTYIYNEAEGNEVFIYNNAETNPVYFYNDAEINNNAFSFTVKIPDTIYTLALEERVRAEVNTYKLSGKTFNIIQYTP